MPDMPVATGETPNSEPKSEPSVAWYSRVFGVLGEFTHIVVISLAIIVPIRYFLIQPFYVKGASMEPTFYDHEYLIIDELSYRLHEPRRGDVVVFRYPNDPQQYFIKRIIGLPGERIRIEGGRVSVINKEHPEGFLLEEQPYLGAALTSGSRNVQVGQGEYYLLGDNRGASLDSRVFGAVPASLVVGRVWLRGWPPEKIAVFGPASTATAPIK